VDPFPLKGVELLTDTSGASWVVEALRPWDMDAVRVWSFLPDGFDAYARILHPAYRVEGDVGTVRWSEIAESRGLTLGPETGFLEISGLDVESSAWDEAVPSDGNLPREQLDALVAAIDAFTATPDRCLFCMWDGYGFWWKDAHGPLVSPGTDQEELIEEGRQAETLDRLLAGTPRAHTQHRDYFLFRGPLSWAGSLVPDPWPQSPNIWWPEDRAWCVATEIDGYSTYIGGDRACVAAVLRSPGLEVLEVTPESRIDPGPYRQRATD
jgi:hypothetical protein